jgi:periplasmic divalent cation tolerance protein
LPAAAILVLTSLPDLAAARHVARVLVESRLAACVQVGAPVESLYHWRGTLETANEIPLAIKTSSGMWPRVEAAIRDNHPYELPEIVAVPFTDGSADYLAWIAAETRPE